jgi:NAD(P) transhydrogenase subunit alpha
VIIGVPKELSGGERRVALIPDSVRRLVGTGLEIHVETSAGAESGWPDASYQEAGARVVSTADEVLGASDLVVKVQPPGLDEIEKLREGAHLVCVLQPYFRLDEVRALAARRISSFALDLMPRTTLAQSMDVLSSMATLAGYKAVLIAAVALPKLMPMMMTAAGTLRPARVLVIGAGVAGLQAIATARRLGAIVEAFDVRAAVKEQIESLGARFVETGEPTEDAEAAGGYARAQTAEEQERTRNLLAARCHEADAVICTALVPGRRAPEIVTDEMVDAMKPGAVIVDLAAEQGGNCSASVAGEVVDRGGVRIHGPVNLSSELPVHASQMFSRNLMNYLLHLTQDGKLVLDLEDELVNDPLVTHEGRIVHAGVAEAAEA